MFEKMKIGRLLLLVTAATPLAACATGGGIERVSDIRPASPSSVSQAVGSEFADTRPAIRRVRLSGDFFVLRPMGGPMPSDIENAQVRIDFAGQQATFDDLLLLLEDRGLSVILGWDDGSYGQGASVAPQQTPSAAPEISDGNSFGQAGGGFGQNGGSFGNQQGNTIDNGAQPTAAAEVPVQQVNVNSQGANTVTSLRDRPLPFRRFEGTLGGLFRQIQRSMGVTIWWNDGIYVSPVGRYSVMLPQNKDLMAQVVTELQAKGAFNVVASMQAGTVSFVAPGALADEVIRPYLQRLGRNASEVTMQVALVSVVMNEKSARGFDWSQFNFAFGDPGNTTGGGTGIPGNTGTVGGGGGVGTPGNTGGDGSGSNLPPGSLFSFGRDTARFFIDQANILGVRRPLDITGAIKFLSTYGHTAVDQNVELRTLAGTAVNWRSGETIPYVTGVSATTGGLGGGLGGVGGSNGGLGGNAVGSAQTDKLETGLSLSLAPTYESNGGLVTVSFKLELTELIEFVNLSAGNQLGSFTQPRTREQKLDDIVRIPVGETVVLGGLRRQLKSDQRTGPFSAFSIGSRERNDEVQTIFVLLRPSVTTYEIEGLTQPLPGKLDSVEVGSDGRPWRAPEGVYRGSNLFGEPVNSQGPDRRKAMRQPRSED